ncbi:restriction endonuclease subunit S [Cysteiniphilum sp. 6C5]|uniref:restriction endonuclease subunit S n=1 Tax=unclassified Cysteiniphilum TaxID=2610889 RepID=UPI003F86051E
MSNWQNLEIQQIADFNPRESLPKGSLAKKIPMDRLRVFEKKIISFEIAHYNGGPKFRNGDTLLAKITPCLENGKTAKVDILNDNEVAFGSSEFIVLRAKKENNSDYLYYLARSPAFRKKAISCMEGTSGRKRVNEGVLKLQILPIPSPDVQKKIASVLSSIDNKIELNNRINAELEAMAKTLYNYWFVQFDFPNKEGKPYKSSGGKMVYNATLKREIPKGWQVDPLVHWVKSNKTGDWGKEAPNDNHNLQVNCIRGTDLGGINSNGNINAPKRFITQKNKHKLLEEFEFIIEISGGSPTQSTGRIAHITNDVLKRFSHPIICSNFCRIISLYSNDMFYWFAYLWANLYDNGVLFKWEGKTSGIKNLLLDKFMTKHYEPSPPKELARQFYEFITPIEKQKQTLLQENSQLEVLRDWLLPMLMNGQVTVTNGHNQHTTEGSYGQKSN